MWETTHIGGDRFAANVVTLPGGQYHGGLTVEDAPRMADAIREGEVVLDRWRGECGVPSAEQAAVYFVQRHLGDPRLGAARALPVAAAVASDEPAMWLEVAVTAGSAGDFRVSLRPIVLGERKTSCADGGAIGTPAGFELVSLVKGPDGPDAQQPGAVGFSAQV